MPKIKALLFDFDGVLADTEAFHWQAWTQALAPYQLELDWETYNRVCVGVSDVEMCHYFRGFCKKPVTVDEIRALYPLKRSLFQSLTATAEMVDTRLVRDLIALEDMKLAVVTSSNRAEVEPVLRRSELLSHLATVVYGGDVTRYKPDPQPYLLALNRLQVDASEAVVFEDSASGVQSGQGAGCRVVRVGQASELRGLIHSTLAGVVDF